MPAAMAEPPIAPSAAIMIGPKTTGGAGQTWINATKAKIEVETAVLVFIVIEIQYQGTIDELYRRRDKFEGRKTEW
jgi:hypothetical protein